MSPGGHRNEEKGEGEGEDGGEGIVVEHLRFFLNITILPFLQLAHYQLSGHPPNPSLTPWHRRHLGRLSSGSAITHSCGARPQRDERELTLGQTLHHPSLSTTRTCKTRGREREREEGSGQNTIKSLLKGVNHIDFWQIMARSEINLVPIWSGLRLYLQPKIIRIVLDLKVR